MSSARRLSFSLPFLFLTLLNAHQIESEAATGKQTFAANCSFCHGATARGGAQGGPDLTQSALVKSDQNGRQLGAFLKVGRPEKGMPAFQLPDAKVQAIAAFLHSTIRASSHQTDLGKEVLVGDAAAGKAFFYGEGTCTKCHSDTGDLKGIGSRYPPAALQGRLVFPVGDGGYPGAPSTEPPRVHVTVTQPEGQTLSGLLLFLSDYAVTLVDAAGGRCTVPRQGDTPKIELQDPLWAHLDLQARLTDTQMHNLTAYLATLK